MDDFANNDQSPDSIEQERDMEELFCSSVYRRLYFLNKMFRISRNVFLSCKTCIHIGTGGGWGDPAHNGKGRPGSTHCTHCTNNCITMEPSTQPFSAPMVQSVWSPLVPGISKLSLFCIQPPSLDHHIPSSDSSLKMISLLLRPRSLQNKSFPIF